jgi:tetratricopeptide (TPR) repeat protein
MALGALTCVFVVLIIALSGHFITSPWHAEGKWVSLSTRTPGQDKPSNTEPAPGISRLEPKDMSSAGRDSNARQAGINAPESGLTPEVALEPDSRLVQEAAQAERDKNIQRLYTESDRFVAEHPDRWDGLLFRGIALEEMGNHGEARRDYKKALELYPKTGNGRWLSVIHESRAESYLAEAKEAGIADISEVDSAREDLLEALRLNPQSAAAYDALGRVYCIKLELEMAIQCFDMAIALDAHKLQYQKNRETAARTKELSTKVRQGGVPKRGTSPNSPRFTLNDARALKAAVDSISSSSLSENQRRREVAEIIDLAQRARCSPDQTIRLLQHGVALARKEGLHPIFAINAMKGSLAFSIAQQEMARPVGSAGTPP